MQNIPIMAAKGPQMKASRDFSLAQNDKLLCAFAIIILALTTVLGAHSLLKLNTSYSIKQFLPTANPLLKREALVRKQFDLIEAPAFLVSLTRPMNEPSDWLSGENIRDLEKLTTQLEHIDGVKRVISISNVQAAGEDPQSRTAFRMRVAHDLALKQFGNRRCSPARAKYSDDPRTAI